MKSILLILSTSRTSQNAIEFAVNLAKQEKAKLVVLYIIETELTNEIFDKFTDIGFIGDKPSTQLAEAIMKEYRQRGYEEMGKAQIKAMEENVDFDAVTTQGDFVEKALEIIERYKIDIAVVIKRKRAAFMSYFSRSVVDELVDKASCRVEIFEE